MRKYTSICLSVGLLSVVAFGCNNEDNPDDYVKPQDKEGYVAPETVDRSNGNFLPSGPGEFKGESGTDVFGK